MSDRFPQAKNGYSCKKCQAEDHEHCTGDDVGLSHRYPCVCAETTPKEHAALDDERLAEWIYNRLRKQGRLDDNSVDMVVTHALPWAELSADDTSFWVHEAQAFRRAVKRNGFKDYDEEMSKL